MARFWTENIRSKKNPIPVYYDEYERCSMRGGVLTDFDVQRVDEDIYFINHYHSGITVNAHHVNLNECTILEHKDGLKLELERYLQFELLSS